MEVLADAITHVMTSMPVNKDSKMRETVSTLNQLRKLGKEVGYDFRQLHEVATGEGFRVISHVIVVKSKILQNVQIFTSKRIKELIGIVESKMVGLPFGNTHSKLPLIIFL